MKPSWFLYSILTLFSWGVWGVCSKLASAHSRPKQTLLFQAVGAMVFAVLILCLEKFQIQRSPMGFGWSFAAGFVNFMGFLFFFWAIERGKVSSVIAISSLYPVVTILVSIFLLHEKISLREGIGMGLAMVACYLLA
jgi:transporter family protein